MLENIKKQLLCYGLENDLYYLAYIIKTLKINFPYENKLEAIMNNRDILEFHVRDYFRNELRDYIVSDEALNIAIRNLSIDNKKTSAFDIIKLLDELSVEGLNNIAYLDIDSSMYNENTPESISELAIKILENNNGKDIVDLGSHTGNFLLKYFSQNRDYNYNGYDINYENIDISIVRAALANVNAKFVKADIFKCVREHRFDKVFMNQPFLPRANEIMLDLINNTNELNVKITPGISPDWLFVEKALEFMKASGKVVSLILNASLSKVNDLEIRKSLIKEGKIEVIIKLPAKVFPYSGINSSLIVLSNNNKSVKYIDASNMFIPERRINKLDVETIYRLYLSELCSDNCKIVSISEFEKYDYNFASGLYLNNYSAELINPTKLGSVIDDMFRGYQISASELDKYVVEDDNYTFKIINLSNINNGIIDYSNLTSVNIDNSKLDKFLVKNGDIIISAKSSKIKLGLVSNVGEDKMIASGNLIVIRPNNKIINPAYLKMFLESEQGLKILYTIQTGTIIMSINPSQLKGIEISLPEMDIQNDLARKYLAKLDAIEIAKRKVHQLEEELRNINLNEY